MYWWVLARSLHLRGDRYLKSIKDKTPHSKPGKQSRVHVKHSPTGYSDTYGKNRATVSVTHTQTVLTQHIYCTSIFNWLRTWCIFQQWEVLDGNFRGTAVKAVQQCITQRVIQSWSRVFTPLLLTHYRVKIRAASSALKTDREMHIYYTWHMWLCGMNRPQQIGHILLRRSPVSEGSQLLRFSFRAGPK